MKLSKGQLVNFTKGEYSDYYLVGCMRILKDFDTRDKVFEFAALHPQLTPNAKMRPKYKEGEPKYFQDPSYEITCSDMIAWLNKEGYIEDAPIKEWHVGAYDDIYVPQCETS